jgi:hypothetical protein
MTTSDWQCDRSIYSNSPDINDNLAPSDDLLRPWKHHKVPVGSTVGEVLSNFNRGARQQFLKDVQSVAVSVGFEPGSMAVYRGILKSNPVRTPLGLLVQTSFNRTFRPSPKEPLSTAIVEEARSGVSSKYRLTQEGDFAISMQWHTRCGSCTRDFETGERVVEMDDGTWRHYWQYPVYGHPFKEVIDVYKEECEDGESMRDEEVVWMDITTTRFWSEAGASGQSMSVNCGDGKSARSHIATASSPSSRGR